MVDSFTAAQALRSIRDIGKAIKDACAPGLRMFMPSNSVAPVPVVSLPEPTSIFPKLITLGLDTTSAEEISRIYRDRTKGLQSTSQKTLQSACRELATLPQHAALTSLPDLLNAVVAAYTAKYLGALQTIEQRALSIASKHRVLSRL